MNDAKSGARSAVEAKKGRDLKKDDGEREKTAQRIMNAARKVFAEHPFKAATTRMIAKEAGVDHPLIHYYYGSKEKLFESVTALMYEEFDQANRKWLEGLERMRPREGFSLYLDRLLDYNLANPEPLQLLLINMSLAGRIEEIPGYQYIIMHMSRARQTLQEKIPLAGAPADLEMFIHCFNNLIITFIGARSCQAQVLKMDPNDKAYRLRVKDAMMTLFLPWLEKLIFPGKKA